MYIGRVRSNRYRGIALGKRYTVLCLCYVFFWIQVNKQVILEQLLDLWSHVSMLRCIYKHIWAGKLDAIFESMLHPIKVFFYIQAVNV